MGYDKLKEYATYLMKHHKETHTQKVAMSPLQTISSEMAKLAKKTPNYMKLSKEYVERQRSWLGRWQTEYTKWRNTSPPQEAINLILEGRNQVELSLNEIEKLIEETPEDELNRRKALMKLEEGKGWFHRLIFDPNFDYDTELRKRGL